MLVPALEDIYQQDLLSELQLIPVWEQWRTYLVAASFICALFPIYMTLGGATLDCVPYNSSATRVLPFTSEESQLTDPQSRFVNELCGVEGSGRNVSACGIAMLAGGFLILISSSFWLYVTNVNSTLRRFARFRDQFIKQANDEDDSEQQTCNKCPCLEKGRVNDKNNLQKSIKCGVENTIQDAGDGHSHEGARVNDGNKPQKKNEFTVVNIDQKEGKGDPPKQAKIDDGKNVQGTAKDQSSEKAQVDDKQKLHNIVESINNIEMGASTVFCMYILRCVLLLLLTPSLCVAAALQIHYIYQIEDPGSCQLDIEMSGIPSDTFICMIKQKSAILMFLITFAVLLGCLSLLVFYGWVRTLFFCKNPVMLLVFFAEKCNLIDSRGFPQCVREYVKNPPSGNQPQQTSNAEKSEDEEKVREAKTDEQSPCIPK